MIRFPFGDGDVVDGLLSGSLPAADAPDAYRSVASLFEAATAATEPQELLRRGSVVAASVAEVLQTNPAHTVTPSRRRMLSKILTAKVAAAATAAAFGLGTAAAAA